MKTVIDVAGTVTPEDLDPATVDGLVALFEKFQSDAKDESS
jgi:hypothetical protein